MGKASASKKVARAARTAGRPGVKQRNWMWPVALSLVVALGVGLVVVSRQGLEAERGSPIIGDHWHAAYGIYVCGQFLPPLTDTGPDRLGIHTHADGLIHLHPFATTVTGSRANLGAFADQVGMVLRDDRLEVQGIEVANGDDCDGEPGVVQVRVWENPLDEEGRLLEGDFTSYPPQNNEVITIAFAPEGHDIPQPPSVAQLADPLAGEEGRPLVPTDTDAGGAEGEGDAGPDGGGEPDPGGGAAEPGGTGDPVEDEQAGP